MPESEQNHLSRHLRMTAPSPWFVRHSPLVKAGGSVLDVAAGGGRHARLFAEAGHKVTAVDKATDALLPLGESHGVRVIMSDLEDGSPWPLPGETFDAVIVSNYLFRPLMPLLLASLAPDGVLLYETFARGNEVYSRPRNPDHLLNCGELLEFVRGKLQVVAYTHGLVESGDQRSVRQAICAVNNLGLSDREDGEPTPFTLP